MKHLYIIAFLHSLFQYKFVNHTCSLKSLIFALFDILLIKWRLQSLQKFAISQNIKKNSKVQFSALDRATVILSNDVKFDFLFLIIIAKIWLTLFFFLYILPFEELKEKRWKVLYEQQGMSNKIQIHSTRQ